MGCCCCRRRRSTWMEKYEGYILSSYVAFLLLFLWSLIVRVANIDELDIPAVLITTIGYVKGELQSYIHLIIVLVMGTALHDIIIVWSGFVFLITTLTSIAIKCDCGRLFKLLGGLRLIPPALVVVVIVVYFTVPAVTQSLLKPLAERIDKEYRIDFVPTSDPTVYRYKPQNSFTRSLDYIQTQLQCCGVNGKEDFGSGTTSPFCCEVQNQRRTALFILGLELSDNPIEIKFNNPQCVANNSSDLDHQSKGCITDFEITTELVLNDLVITWIVICLIALGILHLLLETVFGILVIRGICFPSRDIYDALNDNNDEDDARRNCPSHFGQDAFCRTCGQRNRYVDTSV